MKKLLRLFFCAIFLLSFLSSCVPPPPPIPSTVRCQNLGLKPGTRDYVGCVMFYDNQLQQQRIARALINERYFEENQAAYQQQQNRLAAAGMPLQPVQFGNRNITCSTSYVGNQAWTNCN